MRKFEYNMIRISISADPNLLMQQLDASGKSGWELVSAVLIPNNLVQLYFKREVFDIPEEVL